ncbi:hypothetical protein EOD41_02470 [Mucilaginibacter limnophilus]|uniref:Uncharacterized protein n=1 Tax=Mucilaginibacter limnophilus TaxID=1932778 RepID=A0A3S2VAH7_9SPHI|nr:hypothetical protein [Mucilaginibacter limnophilus]RVU02821.1 hypothetical protein EOD41_02470 [Mucilaginibacter limnophilus]
MATDITKCKCWKRPFEPPNGCFDYCAGKILRYASSADMQQYLYIEEQLAERIYQITSDESLVRLSDFRPHFSDGEFAEITNKIQHLDYLAERWLRQTFQSETEAETSVYV